MPDAMIEIWQADTDGNYNADVLPAGANCGFGGFGRLPTDERGMCTFETIKPGRVLGPKGLQAPHLSVSVFARGILKRLATRIYFANDPVNAECPVLKLVPEDRRATLMACRDAADPGNWQFDLRLCGANETVFFDV